VTDHRTDKAILVIAAIAVCAALYAAQWFFVPVLLGVTLAAVLLPVVKWLQRIHIPPPAGAAIAVVAACALVLAAAITLEPPLRDLAEDVPKNITAGRMRLAQMGEPYRRFARIGLSTLEADRQARRAAMPRPAARPAAPAASDSAMTTPTQETAKAAFGIVSSLLGEIVEVILVAVFLLAAGDGWRDKLGASIRDAERRRTLMETIGEMRSVAGRYFVVTLLINIVQAAVIGLGLWMLGYPTVFLWTALTFLLEFIPYFGGLVMVVLLLIVGLGDGQSLTHAIAGPALYLVVTTIQNNLVSPVAYGRGLRLNPTALLLALIFFWGLWGVAGAFLAVPILAAAHVVATKIESLNGVAAFIGD
jgi:predicted PurR-regulated permease PerM